MNKTCGPDPAEPSGAVLGHTDFRHTDGLRTKKHRGDGAGRSVQFSIQNEALQDKKKKKSDLRL